MRLSLKAIADFKVIYQSLFGVNLTDDEANQKGIDLLELFQFIYRRIPIEEMPKLQLFDPEYRALQRPMYKYTQTINNRTIG